MTLLAVAGCTSEPEASPEPSDPTSETPTGPEPSATPEELPAKQVRLDLFPGIDQPGRKPEKSRDHVATATVKPASPGGEVLLQQRRGGGWKTISRAQQDGEGVSSYALTPTTGEGSTAYRAEVVNPDGARVRSKPESTSWTTIFREEFDGTSLDTSKWGYRSVGVYDLNDDKRCATSDPQAVVTSGGALTLQVRRDPNRAAERCVTPDNGTFDYYLNGRIDTEATFGFTYGLAAARVKFQRGPGQHAAFWLQRAGVPTVPGNPGVSGAEIDVEYFGEGTKDGGLGTFVHYVGPQGDTIKLGRLLRGVTNALPPGDAWWKRYHVFSVEWTASEYVIRIDGREVFRTNEGVSGVEEFLILSLSTKDWELKKLDTSTLPSEMKVDWVRVWQQSS